ncbi:hypothetical protein [Streptomyces cuspidosporus]|uniref:Uncharacterized protein n=1 Tax=Streptomyces cuspidosporus TaxID=66882 RepID=A0ABP5TQD8_9ACTN
MKVFWRSLMGLGSWVWPVALQPASWAVMCLVAVLVAAGGLLAEWQRRATLVALVVKAPPGTVLVQDEGRGGPAMQVHVGMRPHHDEERPATMPSASREDGGGE